MSVVEGGVARTLAPRIDLKQHTSGDLEWAYGTHGADQLALAMLADATGNDDYAIRHHIWFKLEVIATLPLHDWRLTKARIDAWIREHHPLTDPG